MEEQEQLEQELTVEGTEANTDGGLKKKISQVKTFAKDKIQKLGTAIGNKIDEVQAHNAWNKQFELQASEYAVLPLNFESDDEYYKHIKHFHAIKIAEKQCMLIRKFDKLNVNQVLFGKQNQALQIVDFEDNSEPYPSADAQYPIECIKYYYKPFSKPVSQAIQYITNNQTVTVGDNNSGDITLVADFSSQLEEIKTAINNYKPSLLNKKKKDEAIKLYGKFENCVINKQKDQSLFDKFLEVLDVVAPIAVSIVNTIITAI